jgi:hypothetical protein
LTLLTPPLTPRRRRKAPARRASGQDIAKQVAALMAKRAAVAADLARLAQSGETQLSRTDADARLLAKNGRVVAGYNVQIAVDDKHKLIVASAVVNAGNDTGQLHAMATAAKAELGVATLAALADSGYYNGSELKACEADGIVAYVPQATRSGRLDAQGRISHEAFVYDEESDVYRCPADQVLIPSEGRKTNSGGRIEIRYTSRKAACDACALRARCLSAKATTRTVCRWEHEAVLERHRARMKDAQGPMRRRGAIVEHVFGTIKCRAGYRHFLVRGFDKVRGEWSLMALCYNFSRVLAIVGSEGFMAYCAKCARALLALLRSSGETLARPGRRTLLARFWAAVAPKLAHNGPRWNLAA